MIQQRMMIRLGLLFLLVGTTVAWSKRTHKPSASHSQIAAAESKVEARYSSDPKASQSAYSLDGGYHYPKVPGHSEDYVDSEDHKSVKEEDEAQGNHESDDTVKDDEHDEHSEKGGHKEFKAGGFSFDKHLKDHKADNKEVENVKQHDIGEKFGGEITKEHKLGKHKEKSKGHKLHGFKNVYHKEEYGDHKTFHDEFLDTDHQKNYDDHHEHQEVEGGKFSKGFKHEGKNNKYDKGDEKHEWGKEEFDVHGEGSHDKGGNKSKHRHATKKHQGHYDANAHREKNSVHKIKNGSPPPYVHHGGHHGPHQAQIEPYVPHHEPMNIPSHNSNPPVDAHLHQVHYDANTHSSNGAHENHYNTHGDHHNNYADHHSNNHGSHQHTHSGNHDNGHNDEYYAKNGGQDDYHERTSHHHQHKNSGKEILEDKSDEKFIPNNKEEQNIRKHDPIEQKHEAIVRTQQPVVYKSQPVIHTQDHTMQKHEPRSYKHQPHTQNHQSQVHNHQSHTHKHSLSPNHEIHHHRKPIYQDNSQYRSSLPAGYEKFSQPFNERFNNNNHKIRYGFQPRNHQQHNHNSHFHHNANSHHHHQKHQPFPRFAGFNHHHQSHGHHHQPHHHGSSKNHSNFRHTPSYQQTYRSNIHHVSKSEQTPIKPSKSEDQHIVSQKQYE